MKTYYNWTPPIKTTPALAEILGSVGIFKSE